MMGQTSLGVVGEEKVVNKGEKIIVRWRILHCAARDKDVERQGWSRVQVQQIEMLICG